MWAQSYSYTVPKNPVMKKNDGDFQCLPYAPIGFALNGVPIFSAFTAGLNTVEEGIVSDTCCDPVAEEVDLVDECSGHGGPYHYHSLAKCVRGEAPSCGQPGRILGILFDGHPIYEPFDLDGTAIVQ